MIVTEYYTTRSDGVVLNRTYSDAGMMVERDGVLYSEAIDPADSGRTYIESAEHSGGGIDATEADYLAALEKLGVSTDD